MKYYPHHIGDFNQATRHLNRIERSIYRDLIELYYDTEHSLTNDFPKLCRKIIATTDEEVTAVQQVLNEFFTETEHGWQHDRCEVEIERYRANSSAKAEAGKASAAARRAKMPKYTNTRSTDDQYPLNSSGTDEQLTINHKPITINQEPSLSNIVTKSKREKSTFQKPTLEEVRKYCQSRGNDVDPEKFYAHYSSNGWRVGKNPMKDWKASVITWEKNRGLNDVGNQANRGNSWQVESAGDQVKRALAEQKQREAAESEKFGGWAERIDE